MGKMVKKNFIKYKDLKKLLFMNKNLFSSHFHRWSSKFIFAPNKQTFNQPANQPTGSWSLEFEKNK